MIIAQASLTSSSRLVIPFYLYGAAALLASLLLLNLQPEALLAHHFNPHILAITHLMALGWGTMVILGASHQLVPVLSGHPLKSARLAKASFVLTAIGIPMLAYGFYHFQFGNMAKWGGRFILIGLLCYMINMIKTMRANKSAQVQKLFVLSSVIWLFITAFYGLTLVYDFKLRFLPEITPHYLPLHAHTGIIGWFLLLILGVGTKLIPMFVLSEYRNDRLLYVVFGAINAALLTYIIIFHTPLPARLVLLPLALLLMGLGCYAYFVVSVIRHRIKKEVDRPMHLSLLGFSLLIGVALVLAMIIGSALGIVDLGPHWTMLYGVMIFFGWITSLILGMTFKTLPFICWNRLFKKHGGAKLPGPKELYSKKLFNALLLFHISGLITLVTALVMGSVFVLHWACALLLVASVIYILNVIKIVGYRPN